MNKSALLPLALVALLACLSGGCAHQKTRTGGHTSILGGLVVIERGAYQPAANATVEFNTNEAIGDVGTPSGTQVRVGWGAFTTTDY